MELHKLPPLPRLLTDCSCLKVKILSSDNFPRQKKAVPKFEVWAKNILQSFKGSCAEVTSLPPSADQSIGSDSVETSVPSDVETHMFPQ